ncbi:MAG: ABC transporter substrate-binding protein [Chloroflexi bacterium]|nr:ABC transporter substrate-binding protein [Chloroflexota bacterium]
MIKMRSRMGIIGMAVMLLLLSLSIGCGDDDDDLVPTDQPTVKQPSTVAPVVITIGNLTDQTGPASNAFSIVDIALNDIIEYVNTENPIPGVELKIVTYDGQFDPSRDIPGYEWLRERGADIILTGLPTSPVALKQIVNEDKVVLFSLSAPFEELLVPGYVFGVSAIPEHDAPNLLEWIAQNDPDSPTDRPAMIGGASWTDSVGPQFLAAMEDYAEAHPDKYEWEGGYLAPFTFVWTAEVEALKNCDYIYIPTMPVAFMTQYREAGYTAKFLGSEPQAAFIGMIDDANIWDEVDGSLFIRGTRWWNEEGELMNFAKERLHEYHPDEAEEIMRTGVGYMPMGGAYYVMVDIIRQAVESVGAENFNSQALYDAAQSYSLVVDGIQRYSFNETKRYANDSLAIYELRADEKDLFRADPEWIPVLQNP